MKKIVYLLFAFIAFQTANAQKSATLNAVQNPKDIALAEITALSKAVPMDENLKSSYATLFVMRSQEIASTADEEKKKAIFEMYGQKMWLGFSDEQRKILKENKELYNKLMFYKI